MKRTIIAEINAAAFVLLFGYTATSKLFERQRFQSTLSTSPLLGHFAPLLSYGLPLVELAICGLLLFPRARLKGLAASLFMMVIFTVYLFYMLYFTPNRPCSCGGVLRWMSWKQHLVFNLFFVLLAAFGLWWQRRISEARQALSVVPERSA